MTANAQVTTPSDHSEANWGRWLANPNTVAALERRQIALTPTLARRALAAWHRISGGLEWAETPGRTGKNLYRRLRATHKNMPEVTPMENERANEISTGNNILIRADFLNAELLPEEGQCITSADVNNQFLSQAKMAVLGDGEPVITKGARDLESILKMPGYIVLAKAIKIPDHPAFAGRDISAGTAIPTPLATYLHTWGVKFQVKESVVWLESGQRLNKHGNEIQKWLTEARKWKDYDDQEVSHAASIVEIAAKDVYAVSYGGQMRSEKHGDEMMRRDWSDMIVSLAYANALRGLDRAAYDVPVINPNTGKRNTYSEVTAARAAGTPMGKYALGMIKDTAYFLHDGENPTLPDGLEVPEHKQAGKWKFEKHVSVDNKIVTAYGRGITALRNAINDQWKAGN